MSDRILLEPLDVDDPEVVAAAFTVARDCELAVLGESDETLDSVRSTLTGPLAWRAEHRLARRGDEIVGVLLAELDEDGREVFVDAYAVGEDTAAVDHAPFAWLGARPSDPTGYGRLIVENGELTRIVEEKDASPQERKVGLIWGGLLAGEGGALFELARRIDDNNAKREFYLTSLVALGRGAGQRSVVVESDFDEVRPANTRAELAETEAAFQHRRRREVMEAGATLIAPETVFFSWDTALAPDVTVEPNVVFGPGVTVARGAVIRAFSHLAGVAVDAEAIVGPFARLRPGSRVGEGAHVGNFVELKAATLGAGAKANHLSYIGDATVGAKANIGAGTITANYDGVMKHRTEIGAGASIGSNAVLVAPVSVGDGAIVGAGTTITEPVPDDAVAVARAPLSVSQRSAERHRARLKRIKAEKEGPKGSKEA